ncbi:MAG: response regulator, partial [Gammaproteobacteria bacterium]
MNEKTPLQILFIEDSEFDVELAVLELERDGFTVSWKRVELEAELRTSLASDPPQVVLSDYSMPRFDGLSALRVVQELAPDLPFIFLSGTIGEERAIESIKTGATDYVLKGNIRRLATAVRRALSDAADHANARAAEEARSRLAAILEATSDFVAICNPEGDLI